MSALADWWSDLWETVQHSPAILPVHYQIPATHIGKDLGDEFRSGKHYFVVKVNRAFLQYGRKYWETYAPMALTVCEFKYGGEDTVVPFVVGPSLLEKGQIDVPASFLFSDTKVAGIHPYKGGGLKVTVILYQVARSNLAEKFLKVAENLSSVIDLSQSLSSYLKVANLLVRTVGDVVGEHKENQPIIGLRKEFDGDEGFEPGYFALMDRRNIDRNKLWVREGGLWFGDREDALTEFTDSNYVLYSILQRKTRDDFEQLAAIYSLWGKVKSEAARTKTEEDWINTKAIMSTLYQEMLTSPDLTLDHVNTIDQEFEEEMVRIHERAKENVSHGAASEPDPLARVREKARAIRNL